MRLTWCVPLLVLATIVLSACDTRSPITPPSPQEVEGIYDVTEFRFVPDASGVQPADVRARLVLENTNLELFGSGTALFRFKLGTAPSDLVAGEFDVSAVRLRLRLNDPTAKLTGLLLTATLVFDRLPDEQLVLAAQNVTVNLAAYDPATYAGLTEVPGTLQLRFTRRTR